MRDYFWNHYMDRLKIKYKMIFTLMPFILLSYLVFLTLIYFISFKETQNIVNEQADISVLQKAQIVDDYLGKVGSETDSFMFNSDNQELFKIDQNALSQDGQVKLQVNMRKAMYNFIIDYDNHVQNLCVKNIYGNIYLFKMNDHISANQFISRLNGLENASRRLGGKSLLSYDQLKDHLVTVSRTIYDPETGKELGILMLDFDLGFLPNAELTDNGTDDSTLIIVNSKRNIITNTSPLPGSDIDKLIKSQNHILYKSTRYKVVRHSSNYSDWIIMGIINETNLYQNIYHVLTIQIILVFVFLTTMLSLIYLISNRISNQFQIFIKKIGKTNNMSEHSIIHIESDDEFKELADVYNDMIGRIDNLIKTVYIKGQLVKNAEFKAFQAQINPHFLYNTLDCINSLVELNRKDETKKAINALASLMRLSIKGKDILTIRENLFYIYQYIYIQKIRYQDKCSFLVDVPDSMLDYMMPKLILQPLIENAIVHGVSSLLGTGKIWVYGCEYSDSLEFFVKDNGVGIPQKIIDEISNDFSTENIISDSKQSIGLLNMQARIKLLYGKEYGMTISNLPNGGTSVKIRLPKIQKGNENQWIS